MARKTIAVDIDDVLASSVEGWIAYTNERWDMQLKPEEYDEDWAKTWGVDHEESKSRAEVIYASGIQGAFDSIHGAREVLIELNKHFDLVITTSRVEKTRQITLDWLERYYQGIFKEVHFAGFYDTLTEHSVRGTKDKLIKEIGADYLIDDQPKHCFAVAEAGIPSVLFGDYPSNRNIAELPPNVTRCKDWPAVLEYFRERA